MINDRSDTSTKTQKKKSVILQLTFIRNKSCIFWFYKLILQSVQILKCSVYSHHCLSRSGISVEQAVNESTSCQWKGQGQGQDTYVLPNKGGCVLNVLTLCYCSQYTVYWYHQVHCGKMIQFDSFGQKTMIHLLQIICLFSVQ